MIFFLKLLSRLPLSVLYILSDVLAWWARVIFKYRRETVFENLKKSFPDKSEEEIKKIAKGFYTNLSDLVVETLKAISIDKNDLASRVQFNNIEMLQDYLQTKQSVIMIAIHQCNWEWMLLAGCIKLPFPIDAVYLKLNNPNMEKLMFETRSRFGGNPIPTTNALMEIMKRNRSTRAFAMLADQVPHKSVDKYWSTFLNQDTAFQLGTEQLPKLTKDPIIFMSMKRVKRGFYEVDMIKIAEPPYAKGRDFYIIESYKEVAEQLVKDHPTDWLWSHRRWKYKKPLYA
ncbi:MAG: lysophospholipid acyltransferase family protein [Bacteroidota bacterium]